MRSQSPTDASQSPLGESVTFNGNAQDNASNPLTDASLVWRSSKDGIIGIGESVITSSLSAGNHTITLTATDAYGLPQTTSISISINAGCTEYTAYYIYVDCRDASGTGTRILYWTSGNVYRTENYVNGEREGTWTFYYESGNVNSTGTYANDLQDGTWTWYYENGIVEGTVDYVNDLCEGTYTYYYDNGNVWQTGNCVNDLNEGIWTKYYRNGNVEETGNYVNDIMDGTWTHYYESGNVEWIADYVKWSKRRHLGMVR